MNVITLNKTFTHYNTNSKLNSKYIKSKKLNQLHAVSRTQQGKQREPSVKILRSPLSAEFWRRLC